ncbi:MAG: DNA phosphorothioation system sulfurtransferase DndC [Bacillota bacterium]
MGGKIPRQTLQLVWNAISQLPEKQRNHKPIHVISTDTLVESPVVAAWVEQSLKRLRTAANEKGMPIQVHRLTPAINDTYWVNLIGRGYPYPRHSFRWCTTRLKINPANNFIENIISAAGEVILVLGTRKAESSARKALMESYERRRVREHLSPNGSMINSYVFSPIQEWTNDNVWQYLMQHPNPWGHSNKELLAMYRGASADGECPLVLDTDTPSCGNSRFGCWVCTLVAEDKSMAAMVQNDEEKAWMLPLLDFRNEIAANNEIDRQRRDFRRKDGRLTYHNGRLVHGPYTKKTREYLLRRLLEVNQYIKHEGPKEVETHPLITLDELRAIRQIWLNEKHEFEDTLPRIYQEVTGEKFIDPAMPGNKYFGQAEWTILAEVCRELYPDEELLLEMQSTLLDIESRFDMQATRRGINKSLEGAIKRAFFKNEEDALVFYKKYQEPINEPSRVATDESGG